MTTGRPGPQPVTVVVGSDRTDRELGPARRRDRGRPAGQLRLDLRLRGGRLPEHPAADQRWTRAARSASRRTSGSPTSPAIPRILPDGRVVARLGRSVRDEARSAPGSPPRSTRRSIPDSEIVLFDPRREARRGRESPASSSATTGDALVDMQAWSYGLCHAETLPNGDVGVVHYAPGDDRRDRGPLGAPGGR